MRRGGKRATRVEQSDAFNDWIIIGRVRAAHGIRGELRVDILSDFPQRFQALKRVYLGDAHTPYTVANSRFMPKGVLIKLAGIDSRDTAERLAGSYIALPEAETPPLPDGSFHHHQIQGLEVRADDGRLLGSVAEILTTGSNDVYIVRGGQFGELLLPAIAEVIRTIDLEAQCITVHLIPGLLQE